MAFFKRFDPRRFSLAAAGAWRTVRRAADDWMAHEGARLAASLSLYTILSLAPLVILVIAIAAFVFGRSAAQDAMIAEVSRLVGIQGALTVKAIIQYGRTPTADRIASAVGIATLLFGASSVFAELQSALNKIWGTTSQRQGLNSLIRSRLFSFAMVFGVGFLLLVSLILSAALAALGQYFGSLFPAPALLLTAVDLLVSFAGVAGLIALILKYVPDAKPPWRDVWHGALLTASLFVVGKSLFGLYLAKAAVGSAYGAAGSLIVVILWVYYSAMIFYFGAEVTHVRASATLRTEGPGARRN